MGFWSVEKFGSLSKKELAKKPVCPHCGKPAKFFITQIERDYDWDVTDVETYEVCRACARVRLERPYKRTRAEKRASRKAWKEEQRRRDEMMRINPELVKHLDRLGVAI